jgi:hypothetical protein
MVPIKTPEGQAELKTRVRRVSQRHRTVLFLVDGRRAEEQVRQLALAAGAPESCFDELLELGMIAPSQAGELGPAEVDTDHVDLPLDGSAGDEELPMPAMRTLQPDSVLGEVGNGPGFVVPGDEVPDAVDKDGGPIDGALEAPMVGTLTLLRLRGAHSRAELEALLPEVEFRISEPHRTLLAAQTMQHARHLLSLRPDQRDDGITQP